MTSSTTRLAPQRVSDRRLALISLVLALGMFITLLDTTIVNVALDHLRTTFDATVAQTQWIATGYLLAFVSVIPVSGWLSERFGARNAWLFAIAVFLVGSALCAGSTSLLQLVAFRVLQGAGGGLVMPVTMSMAMRAAGPERIDRATVAVALPGLLGPVLGSVLGGAIVEFWSWHWLFFVNVPVCLAALVLGLFLLPKTPGQPGHRFDAVGFALLTPGVVGIAYGISEAAGPDSFGALEAWGPLTCGIVLLVAFTAWSLRAPHTALIDVRVFTRRSFSVGSLITFMSGFSTYALAFLLPLYYQQVRDETVFHTGLLLIPTGLGTMCFFLGLRNLADKIDGRLVVAAGVALTMLGTIPFAVAGTDGLGLWLLAGQFAQGLGFAATTFPVLTLALAGLSYEQAPHGSSAFSVVQRVGAPFGVAVIAVILQSLLNDGDTPTAGLDAFTITFWWTFGLAAIPLALSILLPAGKNAPREDEHATAAH
ncbi:MDR family MFS transporter [Streptomyces shenzhenensis]|uniref:MDR family MFS transporter n=1 Tax=Streptomyces shenzhenensis TaxID=943815 RepID=UPI0033FBF7A1